MVQSEAQERPPRLHKLPVLQTYIHIHTYTHTHTNIYTHTYTQVYPDFITVDGAEGGTGAAPPEFSNHVGMPMMEALMLVDSMLKGAGICICMCVFVYVYICVYIYSLSACL